MITRNESESMKGVAILFIVLHNLLHMISNFGENEFFYSSDRTKLFLSNLFSNADTVWMDIFSFLGWYGVPTFIFLSGYGLVMKYEHGKINSEITLFTFFWQHFRKLFTLMLIPYMLFIYFKCIINGDYTSYITIIKHLFLISNLWPNEIQPGVYWFFGLIFQLYLCYYIFFYKKDIQNIIILNVISFIIMFIPCEPSILSYIRHNFIGWILPFSLGILYAKYDIKIISNKWYINLLAFIVLAIALIISEINGYFWRFSSIISILLAIYLNELIKKVDIINKSFTYIGSISAYLFVIHPVIRYLYFALPSSLNNDNWIKIIAYVITSLSIAIMYKWVYTKLFLDKNTKK